MNIIEPFLQQCRSVGHAAAMCVPGAKDMLISYGRLARLINNVSRNALSAGLGPGSNIALFVNHPLLHSLFILGLTQIGAVTLSGRNPALPAELKIDALITDSFFPYQAARVIRVDFGWTEGDGARLDKGHLPATKPQDICRIILTSGTTGQGKAVALSHEMLARRIACHNYGFGNVLPQCMRTYSNMDFGTSLGFQFFIYTLWRGGTLFLPGRSMDSTIRAFEIYDVEDMITSPAGLAEHLRHYEEHAELRCNLRMILTAGSLLSPSLAQRVRSRMCAHVYSLYGATEMGMVATAPAHVLANVAGAVGYVMPSAKAQIVNGSGEVLPNQSEGIVRVRGPCMVSGYLGDPPEAASAFVNGWFYPGDMGQMRDDGLLVISGRAKSVLNLGGDKITPELIEDVITAHAGVDEAGVFSITNDLGIDEAWALVVPRATWSETALRAHCETKLPMNFIPRRFILVESLPKNANGKLERRDLALLARAKLNA